MNLGPNDFFVNEYEKNDKIRRINQSKEREK